MGPLPHTKVTFRRMSDCGTFLSMPEKTTTTALPPRERMGYEVNYGPGRQRVGYSGDYGASRGVKKIDYEPWWRRPATEAHFGLVVFGGGLAWATQIHTIQFSNIFRLLLTPGPLEISAIGALIWLHAKWRRSVRIR